MRGLNYTEYLNRGIENRIKKAEEFRPKVYPCIVTARAKNTVSVQILINNGYNNTIPDIPICQSPYFQQPIKVGDYGVLIPFDFWSASIYNRNLSSKIPVSPALQIGDCFFLPMLQAAQSETETDFVIKSQDGGAKIALNANGLTLEYNGNKIEMSASGITIKNASGKKIDISAASVSINNGNLEVT